MKIIQTISGFSGRTIVYEIDGERHSITRPACVSFEKMRAEIEEKHRKKPEPEKTVPELPEPVPDEEKPPGVEPKKTKPGRTGKGVTGG